MVEVYRRNRALPVHSLSRMVTALLVILAVAASLSIVAWSTVLVRLRRSTRRIMWVREGLDGLPNRPPPGGSVAVIVPVHNEERVIDRCAEGLRSQDHGDVRIVFVLDRCTDRTAEILRRHAAADARIELVENDHCPPEWAGKCHAAWRGATRAVTAAADAGSGDGAPPPQQQPVASLSPPSPPAPPAQALRNPEWLLFTDADTHFDPRLIRAAVRCAELRGSDLLSLLPQLTTGHRFERWVQPVASMSLLQMYPIERVDHPTRPRAFANGQFMLFRRAAYDAIGGHEAVREDLLEDLAFARRMVGADRRVVVCAAGAMLQVSMYDSFESFRNGWRRIFIEACRRKPGRLRKNALRTLLIGVTLPAAEVALGLWAISELARAGATAAPWSAWALVLAALAIGVRSIALVWIYRLQGASPRCVAAYPLGALVVAKILLDGANDLLRRRPVRWGGKEYVLEPR